MEVHGAKKANLLILVEIDGKYTTFLFNTSVKIRQDILKKKDCIELGQQPDFTDNEKLLQTTWKLLKPTVKFFIRHPIKDENELLDSAVPLEEVAEIKPVIQCRKRIVKVTDQIYFITNKWDDAKVSDLQRSIPWLNENWSKYKNGTMFNRAEASTFYRNIHSIFSKIVMKTMPADVIIPQDILRLRKGLLRYDKSKKAWTPEMKFVHQFWDNFVIKDGFRKLKVKNGKVVQPLISPCKLHFCFQESVSTSRMGFCAEHDLLLMRANLADFTAVAANRSFLILGEPFALTKPVSPSPNGHQLVQDWFDTSTPTKLLAAESRFMRAIITLYANEKGIKSNLKYFNTKVVFNFLANAKCHADRLAVLEVQLAKSLMEPLGHWESWTVDLTHLKLLAACYEGDLFTNMIRVGVDRPKLLTRQQGFLPIKVGQERAYDSMHLLPGQIPAEVKVNPSYFFGKANDLTRFAPHRNVISGQPLKFFNLNVQKGKVTYQIGIIQADRVFPDIDGAMSLLHSSSIDPVQKAAVLWQITKTIESVTTLISFEELVKADGYDAFLEATGGIELEEIMKLMVLLDNMRVFRPDRVGSAASRNSGSSG